MPRVTAQPLTVTEGGSVLAVHDPGYSVLTLPQLVVVGGGGGGVYGTWICTLTPHYIYRRVKDLAVPS